MAVLGVVAASLLLVLTPRQNPAVEGGKSTAHGDGRSGFALLMTIGAFDTATRMGYLLFLPFLIQARGGTVATSGLGLALLFAGRALGKATCGWLGDHLGIVRTVVATETATALLILATLFTPLAPTLILLPVLGIVLNGTSSVLYGTVPELAPSGDTGRGFALFYTAVIGAGGLAPIAYGFIADRSSQTVGILAAAATTALIVPMVFGLAPFIGAKPSTGDRSSSGPGSRSGRRNA